MKKLYLWLAEIIKDVGKVVLLASLCLTAYSVYITSKVNISNYQLNQIRSVREGLSYILDNNNSPAGRGIILQQLVDLGLSLEGLDLEKIHLYNLSCSDNCSFINTNLKNSNIENSEFDNVTFKSSNMENSKFINVTLKNTNLKFSNLNDTIFLDCNLDNIDLTNTKLCGAIFINTNFNKVKFPNKTQLSKLCEDQNVPCSVNDDNIIQNCSMKRINSVKSFIEK